MEDPRLEHIKLFQRLISQLNPLIAPDPKTNDSVFPTDAPLLLRRSIGRNASDKEQLRIGIKGLRDGKMDASIF